MKTALVQMKVVAGDIAGNLEKMVTQIRGAIKDEADIVAFPELCVGGYLIGDKFFDPDYLRELKMANDHLQEFSRGKKIVIIYGNIFPVVSEIAESGRPALWNAAIMLQDGKQWVQGKRLLPNYRIFDDKRYFVPARRSKDISVKLQTGERVRIGLQVCEDLWSENYNENPTRDLMEADMIFNLSASPYTRHKHRARRSAIKHHYLESGKEKIFFYVNNVGAQNNGKNIVTFDGGTGVYVDGEPRAEIGEFKERVLAWDTNPNTRRLCPLLDYQEKPEEQMQAIVAGIRHIDEFMGSDFPYIIGLSGGIDSAVSAFLLTQAVGPDRVIAVNMPSKYNSEATISAADHIAQVLGIDYTSFPIGGVLAHVKNEFLTHISRSLKNLDEENIQAKIRGTVILSTIAALEDGVMVNNGNKVEVATGYATLYGDVNGAIAPLGDLTKIEVWNLAKHINDMYGAVNEPIIPEDIIMDTRTMTIQLPPSAELKEEQVDPFVWGFADAVISYVTKYMRGSWDRLYKSSFEEIVDLLYNE
jgi:NAD+ synthase (glutamine-hydrolysing)